MPKFGACSGQHSAKHTLLDRGQWPAHSAGRCGRDPYQIHPSHQKYSTQVFYTEEFQHKISPARPQQINMSSKFIEKYKYDAKAEEILSVKTTREGL